MTNTGISPQWKQCFEGCIREVVGRRLYTVTGEHASEERINEIINSGEAENIFQDALVSQGRGKVSVISLGLVDQYS